MLAKQVLTTRHSHRSRRDSNRLQVKAIDVTTDSAQTQWSVQALLDLFDVQPDGENRFIAETGPAGEDDRQVVEGTQVLAQAIVAVAKRFPEKSVRSVYAVFARADGRGRACRAGDRRCQ